MGQVLGAETGSFYAAEGALRSMAAAPVESCQSLPNMSPWGRLGLVLDTCTRLHRMRHRFKHFWSISLNKSALWTMNSLAMAFRALREH